MRDIVWDIVWDIVRDIVREGLGLAGAGAAIVAAAPGVLAMAGWPATIDARTRLTRVERRA